MPGAETGRPETSKEFAARVKDHFVLRPPAERKEGGNGKTNEQLANSKKLTIKIPAQAKNTSALPRSDTGHQSPIEIDPMPKVYPSLLNVISESTDGIDFIRELKGKYTDDPLFKTIIDKPREYKNFLVENGLVYLKSQGHKLLCIPNILIGKRTAREIVLTEAHSLLAHLGANKTLDYIRDHLWWKTMVSDTKAFCESCTTCKRSKPSNQKPYGLLNPLPVPSQPWEAIGIDFVGPLPESKNRDGIFDSITVVICLLTAMVHLIPSRITYNARQIAELMFEQIYKLHGLPKHIISDRDVLFTSTFWGHLHELIGTKLKMSSAYHPETDGSTERANRTVTQMLRQCINDKQSDWYLNSQPLNSRLIQLDQRVPDTHHFSSTPGGCPDL